MSTRALTYFSRRQFFSRSNGFHSVTLNTRNPLRVALLNVLPVSFSLFLSLFSRGLMCNKMKRERGGGRTLSAAVSECPYLPRSVIVPRSEMSRGFSSFFFPFLTTMLCNERPLLSARLRKFCVGREYTGERIHTRIVRRRTYVRGARARLCKMCRRI